ncbi:MAG: amidohydrolase family protein [Tepidisphaeraceae bacterium]
MVLDCHVHVAACTPANGFMSPRLFNSLAFRFMRWRLGVPGYDERAECMLAGRLVEAVDGTPELDAAVVLAFDGVHDDEGRLDRSRTHLYVTNDYVIDLARRHANVLFGASVHPYRNDAIPEVERCARAGAALMKWLPVTQGMDPADARCIPFYEALAHHKLPLLCHTGGEQSLPSIDKSLADPKLLLPALERGVTVIAAHCGTKSVPWDADFLPDFVRMAKDHEHFYGDTSALTLPTRAYALDTILRDETVRSKLVHGSDWPIISMPSPRRIGWAEAFELMRETNWIRRDVLIKQRLGFDDAYWRRAARVLRVSRGTGSQPT